MKIDKPLHNRIMSEYAYTVSFCLTSPCLAVSFVPALLGCNWAVPIKWSLFSASSIEWIFGSSLLA